MYVLTACCMRKQSRFGFRFKIFFIVD